MDITVVIPAHNCERYLAQTLRSVLAQTYPVREVIVIDDGSTDSTAAIAERFGDPVRVIRTANQRQSRCRNLGVEQASSEWIAFMDADDLWEQRKLEKQVARITAHPTADVCYTSRRELLQFADHVEEGSVIQAAPAAKVREALFRNTNFLPSSVMIRRSTFLAVGGFDPHFVVVQDWDMWLRLLHAGAEFIDCPEPLLLYRVHEENVTARNARLALTFKREIFVRHIAPHLPWVTRLARARHQLSGEESCAAYILRKADDPGCLGLLARSIAHRVLAEPKRYAVLAHGVYHLLAHGSVLPPVAAGETRHGKPLMGSSLRRSEMR